MGKPIVKYFIRFRSPGTFVDETSSVEVESAASLTISKALELAAEIVERYGAKPYGFSFVTRKWMEAVVDGELLKGKVAETCSGCHFIDGTVLTLADIPENEENSILRSNMRGNEIPAVVRTQNSYRHTAVLEKEDVVLQGTAVVARGEDYY